MRDRIGIIKQELPNNRIWTLDTTRVFVQFVIESDSLRQNLFNGISSTQVSAGTCFTLYHLHHSSERMQAWARMSDSIDKDLHENLPHVRWDAFRVAYG